MTSSTLSKSDYKLACECPQKLFYKKQGYPSNAEENDFLKMLAEGGYVVGKLAQLIHPGVTVDEPNTDLAIKMTEELIKQEKITIHEATFRAGQMVARIDILKKEGNYFELIEVKSKSFSSTNPEEFKKRTKTGELSPKSSDYIKDAIFQTVVLKKALPNATVDTNLLLVDKDAIATFDGLPGWFKTTVQSVKSASFRKVNVTLNENKGTIDDLMGLWDGSDCILKVLNINQEVSDFASCVENEANEFINLLNKNYNNYSPPLAKYCKQCEYHGNENDTRDGFKECWADLADIDPKIWDIYQAGKLKGDYVNNKIQQRKIEFAELEDYEFGDGAYDQRRTIQLHGTLNQTEYPSSQTELKAFKAALTEQFIYPLHLVDFETMSSALPFFKGLSPYSMFPFQFSVHTIEKPGAKPKHQEFLDGGDSYPGFRFAEALMKAIGNSGTPLMWSHHENTTLRNVLKHMDLMDYQNGELRTWLLSMTKEKDEKGKTVIRPGRFVDMNEFALKNYFHPCMKGRTSIKVTLPAIWTSHDYLRQMESFKPWEHFENGKITDPYHKLKLETLPKLWGFTPATLDDDNSEDAFDFADDSYVIKDGGAAMKAYQDMLYYSDSKRKEQLGLQLRKYCELDTLAMAIIYTHWEMLANKI